MTSMSTSGLQLQFLFIRLITYKSHLYKLRHREEVLENFRKFISQEWHIRILIIIIPCLLPPKQ